MGDVQFSSVAQSCPTVFNPMDYSTQASRSFTNYWSLLKFMFIKSVMPYNHLILCHPLLLPPSSFPSIRVFSNESVVHIRWPMYWSFSFSISPSNEYSALLSFRIDWLDLLAIKGLWRVFSTTTVQKHPFLTAQLYAPTLTSIHDHWKNHSFDCTDLCWQSNVCAF